MEGQSSDSFQVEVVLDLSTTNGEAPSGEAIRRLLADRLAAWVPIEVELKIRRVLIRPGPQRAEPPA